MFSSLKDTNEEQSSFETAGSCITCARHAINKDIAMFICPTRPVYTSLPQVEALHRERMSYILLAHGNYLMHVLHNHNAGYCVIRNAVSSQMSCYKLKSSCYHLQRQLKICVVSC